MVMRRLLFFIVITAMGMGQGLAQALIQTYTDRCTGVTQVFTVPMNGQTVVTFYNKSRTFTAQDFQNGTLQAWLEETYLWWNSLSPCSTTTTGATATQQTTQQTTQQATQAATNAAQTASTNTTANVPSPPTNTSPPQSTPEVTPPVTTETTPDTIDVPSTEGTTSNVDTGNNQTTTGGSTTSEVSTQGDTSQTETAPSGETQSTEQTSESSPPEPEPTGESSQESSAESTSEEPQSEEVSTEESSTEETSTEESSTEETSEEPSSEESNDESSNEEANESEESTEESSEEESTEEQSEEESTEESESEEESDESSEEESEEETDEEESESDEDEGDEEDDSEEESNDETEEEDGKKKKKKRNLAPPVVTANMLSQQGPDGRYTQAASFGLSQSSLLGTETYGLNAMVYSNLQQFMLTANYSKVHINKKGRINRVYSGSIGGMKMFSTYMVMMNHSMVWLGEKGSVKGLAFGTSLTSSELDIRKGIIYYNTQIVGTSLTGFYTKSFSFNRLTVAPMLAVSNPFMSYDLYYHDLVWNKDAMIIGGTSFTYKLTQRFGINVGVNVIESTIKDFPTLKTFTIGSRLSF